MNKQHAKTITFEQLHHFMMLDPYYHVKASATESIINSIYRANADNPLYRSFKNRFSVLPCKKDHQRHLIYLWCGMMGLPSYRDGTALNWGWKGFLDNWTQDFDIRLSELQDFLRQHSWPLPSTFFPDDADNTKNKVAQSGEEYDRAWDDFVIQLPKLEEELAELQKIQPESMKALEKKNSEIAKIEREIQNIYAGDNKIKDETPEERKQRLKAWFEQEVNSRGLRGAITRTAKREGITRQTLSTILKRR